MPEGISVIIPAYNEVHAIGDTVKRVLDACKKIGATYEVIVVDDGSKDGTGEAAARAGAHVIYHPANGGYGLSLQHGIREARYPLIAITDADGTYPVEELPRLQQEMQKGFDMVVGARQGKMYEGSAVKSFSRKMFKWLAEYVAGRRIPDINSGLRVFRREVALQFLSRTCLGFSFTTSLTLMFMLQGYFVTYLPIAYHARVGKTKVRHFRDALRTLQIMTEVILRFNPIKLFLLIAGGTGGLGVVVGVVGLVFASGVLFLVGWMFLASAVIVLAIGFLAHQQRV